MDALSAPYLRSFRRQLKFIAGKNPKYTWGGASDLSSGLDCSGYIFLAGKWAGFPGITRTTSYRMSLGLGGWTGATTSMDHAQHGDLVFWTLKESRPNGHVGVVMERSELHVEVAHSSLAKGVIQENMNAYLIQKTTNIRRLSFGD